MIRVKNLSIHLGDFVMKNINLEIKPGEYFVLLGPTGCGKTVLIECLVGIRKPSSGKIWIDRQDVTCKFPEERHIGYLPQDFALFPNMTVEENIVFGLKARGRGKEQIQSITGKIVDSLNISNLLLRSTSKLSGGEKQRVALARALVTEPKVVFLDEPLSAIDENTREELSSELRRIHDRFGTTFVHISHNFEEISTVADKVAIMNFGLIEQVGTVEQILRYPFNRYVAEFTRTKNIFDGATESTGKEYRVSLNNVVQLHTNSERMSGEVLVVIRPEAIQISKNGSTMAESRRNIFSGKVTKISNRGNFICLEIDIGILLVVNAMGCIMYNEGGIDLGDNVSVWIPPQAVHLISKNSRVK